MSKQTFVFKTNELRKKHLSFSRGSITRDNMDLQVLPQTWNLYYHDPNDNNYSLESYVVIAKITNVAEFWNVIEGISLEAWKSGMFFLMREGYRPLWDAPENSKGGAWSKRVDASDTYDVFIDCMVHAIAGKFLSKHNECVVGITLSPKGQFHIIKIWNTTTSVCDRKLFATSLKMKLGDDIAYKAHQMRPR